MDKRKLIDDMKSYCKGGFITRQKLADYLGVHRTNVNEYVYGLEAVNGKYFFIPDVAEKIKERCTL